jgi:hypothetical protein
VRVLESNTLAGLAAAGCAQSIAYDSAFDPTVKALGYNGVSGTWSPEIHCFTDADFPGHAGWYMFLALRDSAPGDARHVKSVVLKSLSGEPTGPFGHPFTGEKFASQLVLDKDTNTYRLELAYDENTGLCPHQRRVIEARTDRWYLGCDLVKGEDGFSTPCTNCGRLPCERYEKQHKEE